jgi:predicted DNA binding protein
MPIPLLFEPIASSCKVCIFQEQARINFLPPFGGRILIIPELEGKSALMQIEFRLRPPSYNLIGFTSRNPHLSVLDWCNFRVEFYQLETTRPGTLGPACDEFLALRKNSGMVLHKRMDSSEKSAAFIFDCNHQRRGSIEDVMYRYGSLPTPPLVFEGGWLKISAICFEEENLPAMLSRLGRFGELKVDAKSRVTPDLLRKNFMIPTSAVISHLTPMQAESLLVAVDHGYYRVPRAAKFGDISGELGIPRTTYEEHVRKAEGKVINSIAPYLSLYFGRSTLVRKP